MASCVADCVENGGQYQAGVFFMKYHTFLKGFDSDSPSVKKEK